MNPLVIAAAWLVLGLAAPVLLRGKPHEETRLGITGVESVRALESGAGVGGHHAV